MTIAGDAGVLLRSAALDCAGRGWRVHPLHDVSRGRCSCGAACGTSAGKHPRLASWQDLATTHPTTIGRWWTKWPGANIGIVTGAINALFALDIDGDQGTESLHRLEHQHGPLPETVVSLTGRDGRHLLFEHPGWCVGNAVGVWPGIDVRGDGGFIVGPPSKTVGRYNWQIGNEPGTVPLAKAPAWLLARVRHTERDRLSRDGTMLVLRKGQRNRRLFQFAALLRRYGLNERAILGCLMEINREHCVPPLPEPELPAIAKSAGRYPPGPTVPDFSGGASHTHKVRVV